jgi:hypothetical protein
MSLQATNISVNNSKAVLECLAKAQVNSSRARLPLILLAGVMVSVVPVLIWGVPNGPDLASHLRFAQAFDESLRQGNFYPAWQHLSNAGYGDGSLRIYSALTYYLLFALRFFAADWMLSVKFLFVVLAMAGAYSVFYWLKAWATPTQALVGALLYSCAPFHLNEAYQAAMLSQFAGAALLALLLGVTERVAGEFVSRRRVLGFQALFAILFAALIFTHVPLAMMAVLTIPLYAALRFDRSCRVRRLIDLAIAGAFGVLLSGFYWVNLVSELPLLKGATIRPGQRFDYRANFVFSMSGHDTSGWYVNLLFLVTLALLIPAALFLFSSVRPGFHRSIRAVTVVALFTFLMATPLSTPLWKVIPKLSSMELPWRWLSASSILASGLAGVVLPLLWKEFQNARRESINDEGGKSNKVFRARLRLILALGAVVIAIAFSWSYPIRGAVFMDRDSFDALLHESKSSTSLEEWLPRWTTLEAVQRLEKEKTPEVIAGGRSLSIQSWQSENRKFTVEDGERTIARLRTFFYPYWQLRTTDGNILPTRPDKDGVLLTEIPAGRQTIEMSFVRPRHQTFANIASILAVFAIAGIALLANRSNNPATVSNLVLDSQL